jgi:hypothetical protein
VDLALHLASLEHRGLQEPLEQSRHCGYVLACPGEAWESVIVLDDSLMCVTGMSTHVIMVLCNLMLKCRALLLQMESRGFELSLSLLQLVHTRVGWDFHVRRSPVPIDRMWESPVPPMRGAIVGIYDVPFRGRLLASVVNNLHHETFAQGVVAPLAGG